MLLDPPVMAPASGTSAVTAVAKAPERAPTQALPEPKPKPAPKAKAPPAVAAAPRAEAPSKPAPAPAPAAPPKHAAAGNEYTVEAGDTLSAIARDVRPDESTNLNQLMLALLKQNPNAFYKDNINALKRGAILRIPSTDQIKAVGSASEAAAQVHSQIEDWRGGEATKPTLVADTGTKPEPKAPAPVAKTPTSKTTTSTASTTPKAGNERLELVPPKAGKDSVAMADRPGAGAGSGAASSELKSELARTKEALTSRDQEAAELKSRVKELEDIKGKSDRQLTLKDSEIADLQNKLKELREQESKSATKPASAASTTPTPVATTPATSSSTSTTSPTAPATTPTSGVTKPEGAAKTDKVSKEDIWGNASAKPDTKTSGHDATGQHDARGHVAFRHGIDRADDDSDDESFILDNGNDAGLRFVDERHEHDAAAVDEHDAFHGQYDRIDEHAFVFDIDDAAGIHDATGFDGRSGLDAVRYTCGEHAARDETRGQQHCAGEARTRRLAWSRSRRAVRSGTTQRGSNLQRSVRRRCCCWLVFSACASARPP